MYPFLPKVKTNYLLLPVEHREGQDQVILGLLRLGTRILYYVYELLELQALLAVGELHLRGSARTGRLLRGRAVGLLPRRLPSFALLRARYGGGTVLFLLVGLLGLGALPHAAVLIILEVDHHFLLLAIAAGTQIARAAPVESAEFY